MVGILRQPILARLPVPLCVASSPAIRAQGSPGRGILSLMTWRDAEIEGPVIGHVADAVARQDVIFRDTFLERLGVRILEAGPGHAVATLEIGPNARHPGGYAHGGAIASLGDTAAAWATFPALERGETHTTIEFKANFIRAMTQGSMRAEATMMHRGRKTIVLQVRITDAADPERLVALMTVTQAVLPLEEGRPEQAR
jgi:1,4-dihydroxy-2-naphthoyl-CoA hydrolase